MSRLLPATALLLLSASAACTAGRPGAERPASYPLATCDGQRVLVVDNQTGGPVDVVVAPVSTGTPQVLTSVRPGRQRVPLPEPVVRAYAEQNGQRVSGGRGRRRGNEVLLSYACER